MKNKIKIFELNEYEWWAGKSLESVIKDYCEYVCDDADATEDARELSDEEMDRLIFHDEDGKKYTFRQYLNKLIVVEECDFPCFFATTEY